MLVEHLAIARRPAVLESSEEVVAVLKGNTATVLQSTVYQATRVSAAFLDSLLHLEMILRCIFNGNIPVGTVINKLALVEGTIGKEHLRKLGDTSVSLPLALVQVPILVEALALLAMTSIVRVGSLVVLAVAEQDLDGVSITDGALLEAALDDLIGPTEEHAAAMWLVLLPLTLVESAALKHANTAALAHVVPKAATISFSIRLQHTLSVPLVLHEVALVLFILEQHSWLQDFHHLLDEAVVLAHARQFRRNHKYVLNLKARLFESRLRQLHGCIGGSSAFGWDSQGDFTVRCLIGAIKSLENMRLLYAFVALQISMLALLVHSLKLA